MNRCKTYGIMRRAAAIAVMLSSGCGIVTTRQMSFPNAETGEERQTYLLDELRDIANDPDLTDDERREVFREMGIEDQDLIEALLTLGPT